MKRFCTLLLLVLLPGCGMAPDQLRAQYVSANSERFDLRTKTAIINGQVFVGMDSDAARASWGDPARVNRMDGGAGVLEQWVYGYFYYGFVSTSYLYVKDGKVLSWTILG